MNSIVPQIRLNFATTSIKSVKEWVVFSFLVLLFSLLSNFAKANDIIYVDAQSNRYPIHLSEPASVQLCDSHYNLKIYQQQGLKVSCL